MEYELSISKEILLGIKPLKNEFRKEDLNLKRLSINIIKGLIIILITVLMIIFLLEILYKKSLISYFLLVNLFVFTYTKFFIIKFNISKITI